MPFTTLVERFNERSKDIYRRFPPDENQLVVVKPDDNSSVIDTTVKGIKYDTRALPISSVVRDTIRIGKLLNPIRSPEAALQLGKQILLQTGNTFEQTRKYNPLSPIINVVPFLHTLRMLKTDFYPYLQSETINKLAAKYGFTPGTGGGLNNDTILSKPYLYSRPEWHAFYNTDSADPQNPSRQPTGPILYAQQPVLQRGTVKTQVLPLKPDENQESYTAFVQAAIEFKNKFYNDTILKAKTKNYRLQSSYLNDKAIFDDSDNTTSPADQPDKISGDTNIIDVYNLEKPTPRIKLKEDRLDYSNIITVTDDITKQESEKSDIIKFIFSEIGGSYVNAVQFRAFLSSIKESVKPEFNEQRYVGRTERFVTYGGAKRSVSLAFNVVAFSTMEINGAWSRINYLSGLAFPKGVKNGFMIPPLFNITIGGIYDNQPCYIESLDFDFLDENTTFDIDEEVPFAVGVTMQLTLLEKRSKFHNSPFYKITEDLLKNQITPRVTPQLRITPPPGGLRPAVNINAGPDPAALRREQARLDQQRAQQRQAQEASLREMRNSILQSNPGDSPDAVIQRVKDQLSIEENRPTLKALMPGDSYYTYSRPYAVPFGTGNAATTPIGPPAETIP